MKIGMALPHLPPNKMNLQILGCCGGIGGTATSKARTTSMLLGENILIDAGTGVGDLSLDQLAKIDHVFLTHSHLDHILSLPLLLDSVIGMRKEPLLVHAPSEVIEALRKYIFNWVIWPDFSIIPTAENPCFKFMAFEIGYEFEFEGGVIRALPVNHHVPAVAYEIRTANGSTVFSGDTGPSRVFRQALCEIPQLNGLIVECAFPNRDKELASRSGHFCPESLADWLEPVPNLPNGNIYITHLKPQQADWTMTEIHHLLPKRSVSRLSEGEIISV